MEQTHEVHLGTGANRRFLRKQAAVRSLSFASFAAAFFLSLATSSHLGAAQEQGLVSKEIRGLDTISADVARPHSFVVAQTNFFEFLRTPPGVDTLVYKRVLFNRPWVFNTKAELDDFKISNKGKDLANGSTELFALRYLSPDYVTFQQISSPEDAWSKSTRLATFFGRSGKLWWIMTPTGPVTTDATNGIYRLNGMENTAFANNYRFATEFLKLGMYDVDIPTIRADDGATHTKEEISFAAGSVYGGVIRGKAFCTNGLVFKISYEISNGGGKIIGRVINLAHENGSLKSFRVSNIVTSGTQLYAYSYYEVLRLSLASHDPDKSVFEVEQFMIDSDRRVLTKEDGERVFFRGTAQVPMAPHKTTPKGAKLRLGFVKMVLAAVLVSPVVLYVWRRMSRRPDRTHMDHD